MSPKEKIASLRHEMEEAKIDAYIVGTADSHQSEYVATRFKSREWLSGFSGSAGTLVIDRQGAGLWTDSRYYLEAEAALVDSGVELFRVGMPDVPSITAWLGERLEPGSLVSADANCLSIANYRDYNDELTLKRIRFEPGVDLLESVWKDRPPLPSLPVEPYDPLWVSVRRKEKLARLSTWLQGKSVQWYLVSALDEICWLLNLRGSDVTFNPVFYAYFLAGTKGHTLFIDEAKIPLELREQLFEDGISISAYSTLSAYLQTLPSDDTIVLPPVTTSMEVHDKTSHMRRGLFPTPVEFWKAAKSKSEQDALRACLEKDGVAMTEFLFWLEGALKKEELDEYTIGGRIAEFRSKAEGYRGESFDPIVGFQANGAIPHHKAKATGSTKVAGRGMLLIDTGGQFIDGTTDMTRTMVVGGTPTDEEIHAYTLVLKGHIRLALTHFPRGTSGVQLDILARKALWDDDKNFGHGTGHGIGFFLCVHEGPQRISPAAPPVPLEPGNVLSDEPGYYKEGSFGVRIENMVLVVEDKAHPGFLAFETLTLCPYARNLVDASLLDQDERDWFNDYQAKVYTRLSKRLSKDAAKWLKDMTQAI